MILHNTTFVIVPAIERQFLQWMQNEYLPAIRSEETFHDALLTKIKPHADAEAEDALSFALQFKAPDEESVGALWNGKASEILSRQQKVFGESMLMFSTVMEII